jgi:ABC-type multidrug transport system fused ATPase/permease subunit
MTPDNMTLVGSVVLSIIYMVFVFIVLLVISYLVDITAFILKRKQRKSKEDSSSSDLKVSEFSISDASDMKMNPKKIAVLSAAIQAYAGDDVKLVVRRVYRESAGLSGWEAAGMEESLRRSL